MYAQVVSMSGLLEPKSDSQRTAYLKSIASNTTSTSTKITQLAQSRQNEYNLRNKQRREEYERFLTSLALEDLEVSIG